MSRAPLRTRWSAPRVPHARGDEPAHFDRTQAAFSAPRGGEPKTDAIVGRNDVRSPRNAGVNRRTCDAGASLLHWRLSDAGRRTRGPALKRPASETFRTGRLSLSPKTWPLFAQVTVTTG